MNFFAKLFPSSKPTPPSDDPATRWEKAVTALNGISKQVVKIDPDGVDVFCFPGDDEPCQAYPQVKSMDSLKNLVTAREPGGDCQMLPGITCALETAFEKGFDPPIALLVVTAGKPDDADDVLAYITEKAATLETPEQCTITFIHIGDDPDAEAWLAELDALEVQNAGGDPIDIVDTVKDEEIKNSMEELRDPSIMESGGMGALLGAFAGMAIGAAGYYMFNKMQAKKRTEGWNGTWEVMKQPGNESTGVMLTVADDGEGSITIEGYPEDDSAGNPSATGTYEDADNSYTILRQGSNGENISGTIVDEHRIEWQDDTVWQEVPPEGVNWTHMALAAGAGAAAGGALGCLVQKKFFNRANNNEPTNYIMVIDRSEKMVCLDSA